MRISATTLESFRLWFHEEWMEEQDLIDTISGKFVPNHKINLGQAFGRVLETPEPFAVPGGYAIEVNGERFEFGADVMAEPLSLMDRRGVFEAKAVTPYGPHEVVCRADQIVGAKLIEHKTTLSSFNFEKYAESYQWRYMADAFHPAVIVYHVFCLSEGSNGVIELRGVETFKLFQYGRLHPDCCDLLKDFEWYVDSRGLRYVLDARQKEAAA